MITEKKTSPIYYTAHKYSFFADLISLIESINDNFTKDYTRIKVLMPSGFACSILKQELSSLWGSSLLPHIISFYSLENEGVEAFNAAFSKFNLISHLAEKQIITDLIVENNIFGYDLIEGVSIAPDIVRLFYEFEINKINFSEDKIIDLVRETESHAILSFLQKIYDLSRKIIHESGKLTKAQYHAFILKNELIRLTNNQNEHLILAGVTPNNAIEYDFFCKASCLSNVTIILPPNVLIKYNAKQFYSKGCNLFYCDKFLLKLAQDKRIHYLNHTSSQDDILNLMFFSNNETYQGQQENTRGHDISYIVFDSVFLEAEYIAKYVASKLIENNNLQIAIILDNAQMYKYYEAFFARRLVAIKNIISQELLSSKTSAFLFSVADILFNGFCIKKFCVLLSNTFVATTETQLLKQYILRYYPFLLNLDNLYEDLEAGKLHIEKSLLDKLSVVFEHEDPERIEPFSSLLEQLLQSVIALSDYFAKSSLYNDFWILMKDIVEIDWNIMVERRQFSQLLEAFLSDVTYLDNSHYDSNVIFANSKQVECINFDIVFIVNCSHDREMFKENLWFSDKGKRQLNIPTKEYKELDLLYSFYLNLHNTKVILTRSKATEFGKNLAENKLLHKLFFVMKDYIKEYHQTYENTNTLISSENEYVKINYFPNQISATDIMILMRAPYNFYARRLLCLFPVYSLREEVSLTDFGVFLHKILDIYNRKYYSLKMCNINDRRDFLLDIAYNEISLLNLPAQYSQMWRIKISNMARELVVFDEERRKQCSKIYTEVGGVLSLEIEGCNVEILSIADRIELRKDSVTIIDFKTGIVPGVKEVRLGLAPQLVLEAMILLNGNFKAIERYLSGYIPKLSELIYVKIHDKSPYIESTSIAMTVEDIRNHTEGVKKLLKHYVVNKKMPIKPSLLKYDDYVLFARRIK